MKKSKRMCFTTILTAGLLCGFIMTFTSITDLLVGYGADSWQKTIWQQGDNPEKFDQGIVPLSDDLSFNDQKQ